LLVRLVEHRTPLRRLVTPHREDVRAKIGDVFNGLEVVPCALGEREKRMENTPCDNIRQYYAHTFDALSD